MLRGTLQEISAWIDANNECRRAKTVYLALSDTYLTAVLEHLPKRERLHLRHTVFRINGLMYLYAQLRKTRHDTRLSVLCGLITYLLDYFYDHRLPTPEDMQFIEQLIFLERPPSPDNHLELALHNLAEIVWSSVPDPKRIRVSLSRMLVTQRETLLQMSNDSSLTKEKLVLLTQSKGHHSLCLYFSIANPDFGSEEANALASFGYYMQYMDDLEDMYEDQSDGRLSLVSQIKESLNEATELLNSAEPDMARFYNKTEYNYDFVRNKVLFYHNAICFACIMRERTRRLPKFLQSIIFTSKEFLSILIPFLYVAPID